MTLAVGNRGDTCAHMYLVSTDTATPRTYVGVGYRGVRALYRLQWQRLTCLVGREWSAPWKLHDVGQRLLLADKKTEEGRPGGWRMGEKGVLAPRRVKRIDDGAVRGYFDEPLRVHAVWDLPESLHDPRRLPLRAES